VIIHLPLSGSLQCGGHKSVGRKAKSIRPRLRLSRSETVLVIKTTRLVNTRRTFQRNLTNF